MSTPTDEQPAPVPNEGPPIWSLVIADMQARDVTGRQRYGVPLQPCARRQRWSAVKFRCASCWRLLGWSHGGSDDADTLVSNTIESFRDEVASVSDAGLCDDCWDGHGGPRLSASVVE